MHLLGLIRVAFFITSWLGSIWIIPCCFAVWFFFGYPHLVITLIIYETYRYFFPARHWPFFHRLTSFWDTPYFKKQEVIFDGFDEIKPNSKAILAVHPHGILCCGWSTLVGCPIFFRNEMTWLATEQLFKLPWISDFLSWCSTSPVHKVSMIKHMKKGKNIALLPGGFQEATIFCKGAHRIFIKERKGFVKYALEYGYNLYPVYVFGEEQTYWALQSFRKFRLWFNKHKLPGVIFFGKYGILPNDDAELVIVVGKPLELPKIENPTSEQIDQYHTQFIQALQSLFDKYKDKYAAKDAKLEIY